MFEGRERIAVAAPAEEILPDRNREKIPRAQGGPGEDGPGLPDHRRVPRPGDMNQADRPADAHDAVSPIITNADPPRICRHV